MHTIEWSTKDRMWLAMFPPSQSHLSRSFHNPMLALDYMLHECKIESVIEIRPVTLTLEEI